ncbi:ribonuclease HI family protein [Isobaculum melis]|uniref:Ribonuclease HI n=1 Tax=Isobaculum melis TaxID=142588 RepID=A0A1H9RXI3_9LACT|nr:ribonuclease HI family protein [Isobaculum melis]SER77075.1 ribonuclease HI [Isobaculum melis]
MIHLYVDAATKGNPGISGIGIIIKTENIYEQSAFPLNGLYTNHQAEFEALKTGLKMLTQQNLTHEILKIYTDSNILAKVIQRSYTKNPDYQPYLPFFEEQLAHFPLYFVEWIPEAKNKGADHLARQGLQKALKIKK